jgi:hypothetical protein
MKGREAANSASHSLSKSKTKKVKLHKFHPHRLLRLRGWEKADFLT